MREKLLLLICSVLVLGLALPSLAQLKIAEELLVDLRAEDLTYGDASTWQNHGTLGDFEPLGTPVVEDVGGRKTVTFDGSSYFEGPRTIPTIEGSDSRSIEVWAYNNAATVDEETMVSWSHRGGPDGTNIAFNYGQHDTWGAVGHWGSPDMPWSPPHSPLPATGNWWHLAYTYDGTTMQLYVNGQANTAEDFGLNTHPGCVIRVAAQADASEFGDNADQGFNFTGSIAEVRIHAGTLTAEDVAFNFQYTPATATKPVPFNELTDVQRTLSLQWTQGSFGANRDVYIGTRMEAVEAATTDSPEFMGNQVETVYNIDEPLDLGQTYYWRIDEVNDTHPDSPWKGSVWSFTVEAVAYTLPSSAMTVAASSSHTLSDPINIVNGSGLDENDQHSTNGDHMWVSGTDDPNVTLVFSLDKVYKLNGMRVWNANQSTEGLLGLGAKDVTIATSVDGTRWTDLETVELVQASGLPTEEGSEVDLNRVTAQHVRFSIHNNWGGIIPQMSLSEVRFYYIPTFAREFEPVDGTANLNPIVPLSWRSGREAAQHEVHLGTEPNNLSVFATTNDPFLDASVDLGGQYYWQVVEVNDAEDPRAWTGNILSFSTAELVVIDDMESYRDAEGFWIWQSWVDGFGDPDNGAVVGHGDLPETAIVFQGSNSMPLSYSGASGTTQELDWTDWTAGGVQSLRLFFSGSMDNTGSGLYVEVNGQRVTYPDDAALASSQWRQWDIPLADLGDLSNVESLTIGVTSGNGILYIDAIGLHPEIDVPAIPTDPGANGLAAQYSMEGDLADSSGNGLDGTVEGGALFAAGLPGMGQAMTFDGLIDFGTLPIGPVVASADSMTISFWADFSNQGGAWQRLFDFGDDTNNYIMLTPREGTGGPMIFAIKNPIIDSGGGNTEQRLYGPTTLSPGWHHIAIVIDSSDMSVAMYIDGIVVAADTILALPSDLGAITMNYLGKSQWPDALYQGAMDEVLIYTRALSSGEISYLAGAR